MIKQVYWLILLAIIIGSSLLTSSYWLILNLRTFLASNPPKGYAKSRPE
jgi:hypothetical protein